jgi:hypothetical protein
MSVNRQSKQYADVNVSQDYWRQGHLLRGGDVVNDSTKSGATVKDALTNLAAGGVTSIAAGTGISVSGATGAVTITATNPVLTLSPYSNAVGNNTVGKLGVINITANRFYVIRTNFTLSGSCLGGFVNLKNGASDGGSGTTVTGSRQLIVYEDESNSGTGFSHFESSGATVSVAIPSVYTKFGVVCTFIAAVTGTASLYVSNGALTPTVSGTSYIQEFA